jgi:hypothetical protein
MITEVCVYYGRENAYYYYYYYYYYYFLVRKNIDTVFWILQHLRSNRFARPHVYRNNELLIGRCQKTTIKFDKQKHKTTGINGNDKFLYQPTTFLFFPARLKNTLYFTRKMRTKFIGSRKTHKPICP